MITFPIWPLRAYNRRYIEDDIVFIETYFDKYVLDNRNLSGNTLIERRLQSKFKLYPLNNKISTYEELIKTKYKEFVDITGRIFTYKKRKFVIVKSYELLKFEELSSGGYLVYPKGIKPLIYRGDRLIHFNYVLIFEYKRGYMIYGFSDKYIQPTRKKI